MTSTTMNGGPVGTAVLLLISVVSATAVRLLGPHALTAVQSPAPTRLEDAVTVAATVVATVLAAWYLATALLGLLAGLLRAGQRAMERRGAARTRAVLAVRASAATLEGTVRNFGAPVLRRAVAIGVGVGLTMGTGPALAAPLDEVPLDLRPGASSEESTHGAEFPTAPPASGGSDAGTSPLDGSAGVPTRAPSEEPFAARPPQPPAPLGPASRAPDAPSLSPSPSPSSTSTTAPSPQSTTPWAAPATTPHQPPSARPPASAPSAPQSSVGEQPAHPARHTVAVGDSLWRIAADRLGPGASDAAVAQEWPRWYAANAATIGPDPNLIRPGQELLAPPKEAGP